MSYTTETDFLTDASGQYVNDFLGIGKKKKKTTTTTPPIFTPAPVVNINQNPVAPRPVMAAQGTGLFDVIHTNVDKKKLAKAAPLVNQNLSNATEAANQREKEAKAAQLNNTTFNSNPTPASNSGITATDPISGSASMGMTATPQQGAPGGEAGAGGEPDYSGNTGDSPFQKTESNVTVTAKKKATKNQTLLYAGIGLAVVLAFFYFIMRKKH